MFNTLAQTVTMVFPLIFTSNLVMAVVKYLADGSMSTTWLRVALGVVSVFGVLATAALTGQPINFDSLSAVALVTVQTALVGIGAHFSYQTIKYS